MAEVIERLVATLEADIRGFTKGMSDAQRMFDQRANTIERRQTAMMRRLDSGWTKGSSSLNTLIGRYTRWAIILGTANRLMRTAAETNVEAKTALDNLNTAWGRMAESAAPGLSFVVNRLTDVLNLVNDIGAQGQKAVGNLLGMQFRTGGIPFASAATPFAGFDKKTGNWTPSAIGFPASGVTDVTPAKPSAAGKTDEPIDPVAALEMIDTLHKLEDQTWDVIKAQQAFVSEQYLIGQATRNESAAGVRAATEELAELKKEADKVEAERIADRIASIGDGFEYLADAALQGSDAFERAVADMARSLAVSGLRNLFESVLGGLSGQGGFVGNLIGGTGQFGGARASGGPVSAGKSYLVGEHGPEMFKPSSAGTIIPNIPSGAGKSGAIVLNMPIDARGAQMGVGDQIKSALRETVPHILAAADSQNRRTFKTNMIKTQRDRL